MPNRPKKIKMANTNTNSLVQEFADFDNEENELSEHQTTSKTIDEQPKKNRKRKVIEQTPDEMDYSDQEDDIIPDKGTEIEMSSLLNGFGAEIKNTLNAKRKRIQSFTQAALKASTKKFEEIWQKQQKERVQHEDFSKQVMNVLSQWEIDLQRTREANEKLENLYHQQSKLFTQQHAAQSQRLKRVVHIHEDYMKNVLELKKNQDDYKHSVYEQLRKETSVLQKKILSDTQQQDFSNVRRSLQTMLAQV